MNHTTVRRLTIPAVMGLMCATVALAPGAAAEERTCRSSLGAITVDNVRVPQGATCTLTGTYVKGTVKVERGATVTIAGARIVGNIQSEGHARVTTTDSRVGGSVQLVQGGQVMLRSNVVKGDVQLFENGWGTKTVIKNRIDGNLQCKENRPAPTGYGNIVGGNKEDQCARL